jgi:hypothetical protein
LHFFVFFFFLDWRGLVLGPIGCSVQPFARGVGFDSFATILLAMSVDVTPPACRFRTILLLVVSFWLAITVAVSIVTIVTSTSSRCATKFITIDVQGGKNEGECRLVAEAIAHSPLVKTAFFASDPNLGRILAAIGYAGIMDLNVNQVQMWLGDVWVAKNGGRNPDYQEADGQRVMQGSEITVKIDLGRGSAQQTMWTCDLSHDYVSINADYRS